MKLFQYLDRISMIHKLVSRQKTGTPDELARQLGVSRTSLYELIDELKSRGAPIAYSKSSKTFFYIHPYDIAVSCTLKPLTYEEAKEHSGGIKIYSKILFFRTLLSELSLAKLQC